MSGCKCEVVAPTRGQAAALRRFASGMGMVVSVRAPQMAGFLDDYVPSTEPATQEPEELPHYTQTHAAGGDAAKLVPGGAPSPQGTTPGSVPVAGAAWNFNTHPATYQAQSGDTFTGLAKTYLPSSPPGIRWKEIWNLNRDTHPNPDKIGVGDWLKMPDEAATNAKHMIGDHGGPEAGGGLGRALLIGAAIAVAGTAIAYGANYMAKHGKRRRAAAMGA